MEPLVVYIIGDNRSGSTLLDYLLASSPQAHSLGEMHHLNEYYNKAGSYRRTNWECSCGKQLQECAFWSKIIHNIPVDEEFKVLFKIREKKWSCISHALQWFAIERILNNSNSQRLGKVIAENSWKVYHSARNITGKPIIIDSSKLAEKAFFLNKYKKGNIRFLLIERDIRAVAYSHKKWRAKHKLLSKDNIKPASIYKHIISCYKTLWHNRLITSIMCKYDHSDLVKRIDYFDLANDPRRNITEICKFLGIDNFEPPLETNSYDDTPHVLGGSPSRYTANPIQPDLGWKDYYKSRPIAKYLGKILYS